MHLEQVSHLYLQHAAIDKRDSIIPAPPASAFGDDEEDYQRVTKQQKSEEQKAASGEKDETTNFGKATFSKAPRGVEELVSVPVLIDCYSITETAWVKLRLVEII